jgi:hypothetical protein
MDPRARETVIVADIDYQESDTSEEKKELN